MNPPSITSIDSSRSVFSPSQEILNSPSKPINWCRVATVAVLALALVASTFLTLYLLAGLTAGIIAAAVTVIVIIAAAALIHTCRKTEKKVHDVAIQPHQYLIDPNSFGYRPPLLSSLSNSENEDSPVGILAISGPLNMSTTFLQSQQPTQPSIDTPQQKEAAADNSEHHSKPNAVNVTLPPTPDAGPLPPPTAAAAPIAAAAPQSNPPASPPATAEHERKTEQADVQIRAETGNAATKLENDIIRLTQNLKDLDATQIQFMQEKNPIRAMLIANDISAEQEKIGKFKEKLKEIAPESPVLHLTYELRRLTTKELDEICKK